jgi:hypothetical protein
MKERKGKVSKNKNERMEETMKTENVSCNVRKEQEFLTSDSVINTCMAYVPNISTCTNYSIKGNKHIRNKINCDYLFTCTYFMIMPVNQTV